LSKLKETNVLHGRRCFTRGSPEMQLGQKQPERAARVN
jgi:hypothetical protein